MYPSLNRIAALSERIADSLERVAASLESIDNEGITVWIGEEYND